MGRLELVITTTDVATPENADKVIVLTVNRSNISDVSFAITGGADKVIFRMSGRPPTSTLFPYKALFRSAYSVIITASEAGKSSVSKTITVTVTDLNDVAPTNIQISNTNLLTTKAKFSLICTTGNSKTYITSVDSKHNHFICIFWLAAIGDMTITVTVSDGVQHTRKDFTISVIALEDAGELVITTTDVATPENADKVIVLTVNRSDVSFAITLRVPTTVPAG
jgi:hypothetical protein